MELKKIQDIIADVLDIDADEIELNSDFIKDLGVDSLDLFQIITALEAEFDIEFDIENADNISTVSDAIEEIKRLTVRMIFSPLIY